MPRRLSPVVLNIIIINVLVFLFILLNWDNMFNQGWIRHFVLYKSGLIWDNDVGLFQPYQVVTSMFSHADMLHILFNMLTLASIGTAVEYTMGGRRFLILFLFSGLVGGVFTTIFDPSPIPVLGASGALFGVIVAFGHYYPYNRLSMFFLPISFTARRMVLGVAIISAALFLINLTLPPGKQILGMISHFGHLSGMAAGWLYLNWSKVQRLFQGNNR